MAFLCLTVVEHIPVVSLNWSGWWPHVWVPCRFLFMWTPRPSKVYCILLEICKGLIDFFDLVILFDNRLTYLKDKTINVAYFFYFLLVSTWENLTLDIPQTWYCGTVVLYSSSIWTNERDSWKFHVNQIKLLLHTWCHSCFMMASSFNCWMCFCICCITPW